jgi:hypothetical protein
LKWIGARRPQSSSRPEEVEQRLAMGDFFMREIIEHGKVMYEANHIGLPV